MHVKFWIYHVIKQQLYFGVQMWAYFLRISSYEVNISKYQILKQIIVLLKPPPSTFLIFAKSGKV